MHSLQNTGNAFTPRYGENAFTPRYGENANFWHPAKGWHDKIGRGGDSSSLFSKRASLACGCSKIKLLFFRPSAPLPLPPAPFGAIHRDVFLTDSKAISSHQELSVSFHSEMDASARTAFFPPPSSELSVSNNSIRGALDIIDEVMKLSHFIRINLHQCKRLVDFYKRARPYFHELQWSGVSVREHLYHDSVDALDKGRHLIDRYTEWKWMKNIRVNQDAFARIHVKLEDSFRVICEQIEAGVSENYYTHHEGLYLLLEFDTLAPLYFLDDEYRATLFKRDAQMDKKHMVEIIKGSSQNKYTIERIESSATITTSRLRASLDREQGVVAEALLKNKEAKVVLIKKLVEGKKEIDLLYESERLRREEVEHRLTKRLEELLENKGPLGSLREKEALAALDLLREKEALAVLDLMREKDALTVLEKLQRERVERELSNLRAVIERKDDLLQNFKIEFSEIQIGGKIGSGGFATIHTCQWQNRDYALKMFEATDVEGLRTEVQNLFLLPRHPNVVLLVGFSIQNTATASAIATATPTLRIPMLLMELLDGDLRTLVCKGEKHRLPNIMSRLFRRDKSGLSTPTKIDFIYQIAKGMQFLHKRKVFHGDLKAKNVLVKQRPGDSIQLKITDFGLSEKLMIERKIRNKSNSDEDFDCFSFSDHSSLGVRHISEDGNVQRVVVGNVGTVRWMAPEVYGVSGTTSMKPYSMKADVYSFSMTCVEILTEQHPYPHIESTKDVRLHVKSGERPDLSTLKNDFPRSLLHLVQRCWDADPSSRPDFSEIYSSMKELKKAFPIK